MGTKELNYLAAKTKRTSFFLKKEKKSCRRVLVLRIASTGLLYEQRENLSS